MFPRPESLDTLLSVPAHLALEGPLSLDEPAAHWLEAIGVVRHLECGLVARADWLASAFPARGERDLVRRVAFLDPAYRLHLDVLLARVLVSMARDRRLAKVEEYLTGPLTALAPRLAHLLPQPELNGDRPDSAALEKRLIGPALARSFVEWDRSLFGDILGGPEQRFPVLVELYGPVAGGPVHLRVSSSGMTNEEVELAADLIHAGWDRQGVHLGEPETRLVSQLVEKTCLPVRAWSEGAGAGVQAACVGPIVLLMKSELSAGRRSRCPVPGELPRELVQGRVVEENAESLYAEKLWSISEDARNLPIFPGSNIFDHEGRGTPVFDVRDQGYLATLAGHPLFGLFLQFFVIEAFGRELGDESITVLPVGSPEHPERIDVYYRPPGKGAPPAPLGNLDDVLDTLASRWGLRTLSKLWERSPYRTWSQALLALLSARIVAYQAGEYILARSVFDDCHSRTHMQAVLRRGQSLRDRMHEALLAQYQAKAPAPRPVET
jgi:hypothetical protein